MKPYSSSHSTIENRSDSDLKRFVLMFYSDLAREIVEGWGLRLDALMKLAGYNSHTAFVEFCRSLLDDARGPAIFAATMVRERAMARTAGR